MSELRCKTCKRTFTKASSLKKHIDIVDCEPDKYIDMQAKKHICELCNKEYTRRDSLKRHVATCKNTNALVNKQINSECGNVINTAKNVTNVNNINNYNIISDRVHLFPYYECLEMGAFSYEERTSILQADDILLKYFELMHCNTEKPDYLNIKYISQKYVDVFTGTGWETKDSLKTMYKILENICICLQKFIKSTKGSLIDIYVENIIDEIDDVIIPKDVLNDDRRYKIAKKNKNSLLAKMLKSIEKVKPGVEVVYNYHKLNNNAAILQKIRRNDRKLKKMNDLGTKLHTVTPSTSDEEIKAKRVDSESSESESSESDSSESEEIQTKSKSKNNKCSDSGDSPVKKRSSKK